MNFALKRCEYYQYSYTCLRKFKCSKDQKTRNYSKVIIRRLGCGYIQQFWFRILLPLNIIVHFLGRAAAIVALLPIGQKVRLNLIYSVYKVYTIVQAVMKCLFCNTASVWLSSYISSHHVCKLLTDHERPSKSFLV